MRRLAGDEERLADRARWLQAGLQQQVGAQAGLEKPGNEKGQAAIGDAARDLARLAERMQQSADQLRAAGGRPAADRNPARQTPRPEASAQQDTARLLDRVADKLGAATGAGDEEEARKLSSQLARTQELREKLDRVSRALASSATESARNSGGGSMQKAGESGRTGEGRRGAGGLDMTLLREESLRQLRETRKLLDDLQRQDPGFSKNGAGFTFEGQGMILSAPGTEGFKQDFARWENLKRQATLALEQAGTRLSKKLQANDSKNRLAAGVEDRAPAEYQQQVDSYFKAIAAGKKQ
jgi:hypothetical protein